MAVKALDGIADCRVDLAVGTMTVAYHGPDLDVPRLTRAVESAGYTLLLRRTLDAQPLIGFVRFLLSQRGTTLTVVAGLSTAIGLLTSLVGWQSVSTPLFAVAILVGGWPIVQLAAREIWHSRSLGINTLMVIAVTGAMLIGEWAEAAIVVVLFSLGEALEGYATERARGALDGLLDLAPPVALRLPGRGSASREFRRSSGGRRPGAGAPGRSGQRGRRGARGAERGRSIARSPARACRWTRSPGTRCLPGTINTSGALEVEVTRLAADNTLSRMVALVQQAQSHQAPVQRFIDRFARVYTPAVTVAAALVAIVPPLFWAAPSGASRAG